MAAWLLAAAPALAVEPVGDPAAPLYRLGAVDVIYLTLSPASEAALNSEPDEYVEGTFSRAETDGTPSGVGPPSEPLTVGIRLKGQLGSARSLAQKAAFKIKFNWAKGQKFLGLKKLTLNNMVQDPSNVHEALGYAAFRSSGVAAPRTGYAYVYVNGVDYGLHLDVENVDDVATEKRFGPFQHVYEGAYGSDVETAPAVTPAEVTEAASHFEVDEGDEDDRTDLEALIAAVNDGSGDWSRRVETLADLKEMTRMWAVEKYVGNWDGYAGMEGGYWPNNFYLQSDPDGWFRMLPWGIDQTWSEHLGFDGDAGVLFDRCLADDSCAEMYRRSLRQAQAAIAGQDPDGQAAALEAALQPWIEQEQANARHEYSLGQFQAAVQATRDFIASRAAELTSWLGSQPPEVPASQIQLGLEPDSIVANGVATTTATVAVTDADGNPIPGDEIVLSSSDHGEQATPVVDNDDGTYSAQIVSSTQAGEAVITATDTSVAGSLSDSAELEQVAGLAARLVVTLQPALIPADGGTTSVATAKVSDAHGNPVSGDAVHFSSSDSGQRFGAVRDNGNGTYSVTLTASSTSGSMTIVAADSSVAPAVTGSALMDQTPLAGQGAPADFPASLGSATPGSSGGPAVTLAAAPRHRSKVRRPTFRFGSPDPSATFLCKLDRRPYRACTSPLTLPKLAPGRHTFIVRTMTATGFIGPVNTYAFTVTAPHSH